MNGLALLVAAWPDRSGKSFLVISSGFDALNGAIINSGEHAAFHSFSASAMSIIFISS